MSEQPKVTRRVSRVVEVNRVLRQRGRLERLVRGRGYYYFAGGNSTNWPTCSVWVYRADDLTVERWLQEFDRLRQSAQGFGDGWI